MQLFAILSNLGWGANSSYKDDPNDPQADWQFTNPESLLEKQMIIEDRNICFDHWKNYIGRNISMGMICANTTNFEGEKNAGQCRVSCFLLLILKRKCLC